MRNWQVNQYRNLQDALEFYLDKGYEYIEVPWIVENNFNLLTTTEDRLLKVGDGKKSLVGSGEQSFFSKIGELKSSYHKYMTITPCFRPQDDDPKTYHYPYFLKLELFAMDWQETEASYNNLDKKEAKKASEEIQADAMEFFSKFGYNLQVSSTAEGCCDINLLGKEIIEIGSYGVRHLEDSQWGESSGFEFLVAFGTGLAEPRFSRVLEDNFKAGYHEELFPKAEIGTPEKLIEEVRELKEAIRSKNWLVVLCEISDLYASLDHLADQYCGEIEITKEDVMKLSKLTKRAFQNGRRS